MSGIEGEVRRGTIMVCMAAQRTGCGITYCKEKSIVKCAKDIPEWKNTILVYRNENEMALDSCKEVDRSKLRSATSVEITMYYQGYYFLEPEKTK